MFSSGFFLLPGLAAAQTGASVILAYLLACVLILPAMFSMSELSTAMPKAGGAYYFIDRSMGPLAGTVGGVGIYAILVLKTAFALIGIGAYTVLIMDLPIKEVAVTLTIVFMALNIFGAKETAILQRILVYVLGVFIIVVFLPPTELYASLTPVADAVSSFSGWIPVQASLFLIVAAAFASFASTGNAGLLSASRYPLAMARDQTYKIR